jgi:DNA-binding transcriptional LysR family regulator
MDLYKLKTFYTVAKLGSFSRAAETLYLTQPAVSAQIKDLEYEYNTQLFNRVGRKISLTRPGETLIEYVKNILDIYEESHYAVDLLKSAKDGQVKLAVSDLPGSIWLPQIISLFQKEYPEITFSIKNFKSTKVVNSIRQNKVSIGIVVCNEASLNEHELVEKVLYKDKIVLGVSKQHPLAAKDSLSIKDLANLPLIMSLKDTVLRHSVDKMFHQYDIPYTIAYEIDNKTMIKSMVENNLGIAFFSSQEIKAETDAGTMKAFDIEDFPFYCYIIVVYHKKHQLSPSLKAFYDFMFSLNLKKKKAAGNETDS